MWVSKLLVCSALAAATAAPALAQEFGNSYRGQGYAREFCSGCHAVEPDQRQSPDPTAPPFAATAKVKGMTAMALAVWLRTSHPTMPNISLKPETMNDIIAYIVSLRPKQE